MIRIEPAGAEALLLVLAEQIRQRLGVQLIDLVPGWTSLLLHYDLLRCNHQQLIEQLTPLLEHWLQQPAPVLSSARLHELPLWYAGEDLPAVAQACGLTEARVIELHSSVEYRVGVIGFAPGFAYLGELDARLALPRRNTPRSLVPAGSLAIAERQTAIYPQASPGGWHLLGRCPWPLFDLQATPPCRLAAGDRVRFVPVDEQLYLAEGGVR